MPLVRDGLRSALAWCERTCCEILRLPADARHDFPRTALGERLIVVSGTCRLACGAEQLDAAAGTRCELRGPEARLAGQRRNMEELAERYGRLLAHVVVGARQVTPGAESVVP